MSYDDIIKAVADAIREAPEGEKAEAAIEAFEDANERAIGVLIYRGNSVSWTHSKAENYKAALGRAWDALREAGIRPDGKTELADAIRAALAVKGPPQPATQD